MGSWIHQAIQVGAIALIGYVGLFIGFMVLSDHSIYHPPKPTDFKPSDTTHTIQVGNQTVAATYLPNKDSEYVILFSHGNAADLGRLQPMLEFFHQQGYAILAYDYPGYSISSGRPSESAIYQTVEAVYDYMITTLAIAPEKILAYGRSLGSGPSVHLAKHKKVGGLVLEAPFTSVFRVYTHVPLFPYDKFNNARKISKVREPILIVHGEKDDIVPFWHGLELFDKAQSPKMHLWLEDADHNDVIFKGGERYWQTLESFIQFIQSNKENS